MFLDQLLLEIMLRLLINDGNLVYKQEIEGLLNLYLYKDCMNDKEKMAR